MRRWDPAQMFDDMQREMLRFFGPRSPFGSWLPFQGNRAHLTSGAVWAPSVDVYEQGNNIVVKAELPGVKKEDIEVELDQGSLILRGQRQEEKEVRDEQYYRSERTYGSFYRRIPVPEGIKPDQINASFKDGLLEVRLPKPQEAEPKRLKINVR
jgi:HSP20 family protein